MLNSLFNPFTMDEGPFPITPEMTLNLTPDKMHILRYHKSWIDTELIKEGVNTDVGCFVFRIKNLLDEYSTNFLMKHYRTAGWHVTLKDDKLLLARRSPVQVFTDDFGGEHGVVHFLENTLLLEVAGQEFQINRADVRIFDEQIDLAVGCLVFLPHIAPKETKDAETDARE